MGKAIDALSIFKEPLFYVPLFPFRYYSEACQEMRDVALKCVFRLQLQRLGNPHDAYVRRNAYRKLSLHLSMLHLHWTSRRFQPHHERYGVVNSLYNTVVQKFILTSDEASN